MVIGSPPARPGGNYLSFLFCTFVVVHLIQFTILFAASGCIYLDMYLIPIFQLSFGDNSCGLWAF